jgi:hypothetical protein
MKHKRILFSDLPYQPSQNPYSPKGFRKMENVWYSWEDGVPYITMVPGYTLLGSVANGSSCRALAHISANSRGTFFYTEDDLLYKISGSGSFDSVDISGVTWDSSSTNSGRMSAVGFGDQAYIFSGRGPDGADNITFNISDPDGGENEYGDTGVAVIGFDRPDVSGSSSAAGSGSGTAVKGVVKYFVSYTGTSGAEEGPLSVAFGEIDAGDGDDVDLSGIPTSGGNKRRLYRTFSDGDQPFYLATLNSSDATYTDNIADADLGDLPLKHGDPPPARAKSPVVHYGRVYVVATEGATRTGIYWSDPSDPSSWYTTNFGNWFDIPGMGKPKAMGRVTNGLVVFFENVTVLIEGRSPSEFNLREITAFGGDNIGIGVSEQAGAERAIAHSPGGLFFYHKDSKSVYHIGGSGLRKISEAIDADLFAIESVPTGSSETIPLCLQWLAHLNLLAVSSMQGDHTNQNVTWFYDPSRNAWVGKAGYGFRSIASWEKDSSSGDKWSSEYSYVAYGEDGNRKKIFQILTGTDHNGSAIVPVLGCPTFSGDDPTVEKTFHYVDILCKPVASETLKVEWFIDGATTADGSATATMTGTNSRERHRFYINERGRELDVDITLDDASGNSGVYGAIYGYTDETSVVGS